MYCLYDSKVTHSSISTHFKALNMFCDDKQCHLDGCVAVCKCKCTGKTIWRQQGSCGQFGGFPKTAADLIGMNRNDMPLTYSAMLVGGRRLWLDC